MQKLNRNLVIFTCLVIKLAIFHIKHTSAAIIPAPLQLYDALDIYPLQPNEVVPIQPVLLYPKMRKVKYQGRNLDKDNEIIYVQLLKRRSYRPKQRLSGDGTELVGTPSKELTMEDIFYVKALANGQFSHQRVKWYRLPEFFAINVYHKGDKTIER